MYSKGVAKIGNLYGRNGLDSSIIENLTPLEIFSLRGIIDAIPTEWRKVIKKDFAIFPSVTKLMDENKINLYLNDKFYSLETLDSKEVYSFLISNTVTPTAQKYYEDKFNLQGTFNWPLAYQLPFLCSLETKLREFQYKVLNRILFTKSLLYKIKMVDSPLCSLCSMQDETIEHLFFHCDKVRLFWEDLKVILTGNNISLDNINEVEIILGITRDKNESILLNHIMLLVKKYIYSCSLNKMSYQTFLYLKRNLNMYTT